MSPRSMEWWWTLALALAGGVALPVQAGIPVPGCRPPAVLKDVAPGAGSAVPSSFVRIGETVYFVAQDGERGAELWRSDGTEAGTRKVVDLNADVAAPGPEALTFTGGVLSFSADDGTLGREPHSLSPAFFGDCTPPSITCPADLEVTATAPDGARVSFPAAQATDTVSDVTLHYGRPSGSDFPVGETPVRVTAADASGNLAECTFSVKVHSAPGGMTDAGCSCTGGFAVEVPWLLLGSLAPLLARRRRPSR